MPDEVYYIAAHAQHQATHDRLEKNGVTLSPPIKRLLDRPQWKRLPYFKSRISMINKI
jgi:hypothetical protein